MNVENCKMCIYRLILNNEIESVKKEVTLIPIDIDIGTHQLHMIPIRF